MKLYCHSCGGVYTTRAFKAEFDELRCDCGAKRSSFRKPTGEKAKRRSTFKQPQKSISPASAEQRAKVKDALSIISGAGQCDPTHLWDRRLGGCDDALCVVPATRFEHREFEEKRLDILPALVAGGFFAEMGHVIAEHQVSPTVLVERLTGQRYGPLEPLEDRIAELEAALQPPPKQNQEAAIGLPGRSSR